MDIADIRRLYDIRELLGLPEKKRWLVCPLPHHPHTNYTPSFSIYYGKDGVQRFKCHGNCGAQGDVIDLAGYLWITGYNPRDKQDVRKAIEVLGIRGNVSLPIPERSRSSGLGRQTHKKYLPIGGEARKFAHSRGLNDDTIKLFKLGQDHNYLTMPYFRDGMLRGIKKRRWNGRARLRYICEEGSKGDLFNIDMVQYDNGRVFVVKAEIPCMLLVQWGYKAVAPTGGEGNWDKRWRTDLGLSRLTVIGDNDEAGARLAKERAIRFGAYLEFPPQNYKDVDEYMLAEPKEARQWLEAIM